MTHLSEFLAYYGKLKTPGYAVLVTGAWGIGKTHQVKAAIPEKNLRYVSLFGLSSLRDVESAIMAAVDPDLKNALAAVREIGGGVWNSGGDARASGKAFAGSRVLSDTFDAVFRRRSDPGKHILVVDDLDRSSVNTNELLGVVNRYVEHCGFRVVVIAHEEELIEDFSEIKEKIFGRTIAVEPQTQAAADRFIEGIGDSAARKFVAGKKKEILSVFGESGQKSLRVLRHVVFDLGRLYSVTGAEFRKLDEAMLEVAKLFSALAIEVRSGRLAAGDLRNRAGATILHNTRSKRPGERDAEAPPIVAANERYASTDLESHVLDDDVLVDFLINGHFRADQLSDSLGRNWFFRDPAKLRPWQILSKFFLLPADVIQTGIDRLQKEFKDRAVTDSGEMLHIFTQQMMLVETGAVPGTVKQVADDAIAYIDDLLKKKRLPPREPDVDWMQSFLEGHDQTVYWSTDATKTHFQRILDHLITARVEAHRQAFIDRIGKVLDQVKSDGAGFRRDFSILDNTPGSYAFAPVLKNIPADRFVGAWLEGDHDNQIRVRTALEHRYHHGHPPVELADEHSWVRDVIASLDAVADAEQGGAALRLKRMAPRTVRKYAARFSSR